MATSESGSVQGNLIIFHRYSWAAALWNVEGNMMSLALVRPKSTSPV